MTHMPSKKTNRRVAIQATEAGTTVAVLRSALVIVTVVAAMILFVWSKVEIATLARGISDAERTIGALAEEKSRLSATVTVETKPGFIQQRAREQLGMIYVARGADLVVRYDATAQ